MGFFLQTWEEYISQISYILHQNKEKKERAATERTAKQCYIKYVSKKLEINLLIEGKTTKIAAE